MNWRVQFLDKVIPAISQISEANGCCFWLDMEYVKEGKLGSFALHATSQVELTSMTVQPLVSKLVLSLIYFLRLISEVSSPGGTAIEN